VRDELAFSRALTERFGKLYCIPFSPYPCEDVPMTHLIGALPVDDMYICVAAGDWEPTVRPIFVFDRLLGYSRRWSPFHFRYTRCYWVDGLPNSKYSFDPPYLIGQRVEGYVPHFDPLRDAIDTFLGDGYRCLGKAGRGRARASGKVWGHDAIRDALARGPRGSIEGWYRPEEKWKFPHNSPYYRDELWDDDPSTIRPLVIRGSKEPVHRTTPAEYNAWRASQPKETPKVRTSSARSKLSNLRIDPSD
jgi:hypothetical protein